MGEVSVGTAPCSSRFLAVLGRRCQVLRGHEEDTRGKNCWNWFTENLLHAKHNACLVPEVDSPTPLSRLLLEVTTLQSAANAEAEGPGRQGHGELSR